jgi:RNA 2',3'-cyclic 3'-phosphodiesterase
LIMKKKRCFISVRFSREIVDEISRVQDELGLGDLFDGKLVERENLHLTLKFLGEIDSEKIEEVRKRLREIRFDEFFCELGDAGLFSEEFIRIVWVKVLGEGIIKLQKEIDDTLEGIFERERRFMGHLTVARVKKVFDKEEFLESIKRLGVGREGFFVKEFYLMESELSSEGSEYKVIEEVKLV